MQILTTFIQNNPLLSAATLVVLIFIIIVECIRTKRRVAALTPTAATQLINRQQAVVIDLRSQELFRKGHIIDALCMSARDVQQPSKKIEKFKTKPIIIVCALGVEAQKTAAILKKQGYQAQALAGGMRAWLEADMPVVKN
ncbi:MAG TPA: rhodanese-like domain-containing protein [Gammaproteobacteria bacterium]|jgi:rhodanese-related sulfurtransferase|nr:rhodanese-like domain-containing protein [Gammaproteobacteria bacterium]